MKTHALFVVFKTIWQHNVKFKIFKYFQTFPTFPTCSDFSSIFKYLKSSVDHSYDLIFADPPYGLAKLATMPNMILDNGFLNEDGLLIIEHDAGNDFRDAQGFTEKRNYGETIFSFFGS